MHKMLVINKLCFGLYLLILPYIQYRGLKVGNMQRGCL